FSIPTIVSASQLFPPEIPVLFYGDAEINNEPVAVNTVISITKEVDNIEIDSSTTKNIGKYFFEVSCKKHIGENIFFKINDLISGQSQCVDVSTVPSVKLDLTINNTDIIANQWTKAINTSSDVGDEVEIKISFNSALFTADKATITIGPGGLSILKNSSVLENRFEVNFLPNTIITGDSNWDGKLITPTLSEISLDILPVNENKEKTIEKVMKIGFDGNILSLDKPVSILFPQMSGFKVGYSCGSSDFTEIANMCPLNNGDSLVGDNIDCKFDNGIDLIVWTKHFTNFVIYSQTVDSESEVAGSAGSQIILNITPCVEVIYDQWQKICVNNWQYRNIISKIPNNCVITKEQKELTKRKCGVDENGKIKVLGAEFYPDNSLIRGSDMKIYLIENQIKRHIINLKALERFTGMEIFNTSDEMINLYSTGDKIFSRDYKSGDLIRGSDMKVYIIKNNKKHHIINLKELLKYAGQWIYNVNNKTLAQYH
ncbi:MAG: hypothetical protein U9R14_02625, partial [Patescibacteria group bacterium]|nr:hypothetical protein [Patescibacteria group bacterium]